MQSRSRRSAAIAVALVAAVSACTNGTRDAAPAPATAVSAAASVTASATPSPPAAAPDPATCFLGTFDVVSITSKQGVATPFGTARPAGTGGSLILDLRADNSWRLRGDGSRLASPVGSKEYDMDAVGSALAPAGAATITCGPDTVDLASESVTMTLKHH